MGNSVRYDGNHKLDRYIRDTLGQYFDFVPVCPEVECGLGVPREAMILVRDDRGVRLVTVNSGADHTDRMNGWCDLKKTELSRLGLSGFIFKSRSPSSGMTDVKIYSGKKTIAGKGAGLFAASFMRSFPLIPVIDEGRFHDPALRENFIEGVFVYRRWLDLLESGPSTADLSAFHAAHKYLIMSHHPAAVARLGSIVAASRGRVSSADLDSYGSLLMKTLALKATVKKHCNVLEHLAGYFKKDLSADGKKELLELIDSYRKGLVPLVVPVTLMRHYTRLYGQDYLAGQVYLNPHPLELMLRNHV
jgi:uncharacterized protein YbgA (DUF1722 family)/uncharacterized protein YbbK (DUF523 family)